jgi:transposase
VPDVVAEAEANGLERPTDPEAEWTMAEVEARDGVRHVVVYSAFRAIHDKLVRRKRLKQALVELVRIRTAVAEGRARSERKITERVAKILRTHRVTRYIRWELVEGKFEYRVDLDYLRQQRRLDGIYVLVSNDSTLSATSIVEAYRQLYEVENAFRVLKSLVKMRPMFHYADRRIRSHVLVCVLSYLIAKVLEQRLRRAGIAITADQALQKLNRIQAVEYETEGYHIVQMTQPDPKTEKILRVLGLDNAPPILYTERIDQPEQVA